jgi:manganese/iron transport system substrate-binding protein
LRRATAGPILLFLLVVLAAGCGGSADAGDRVRVAATISVIEDMVERVGGDHVEVYTIVPVGGSPETFQPSPRDAGEISEARVVFENGLGLDAWVEDLVESAGSENQRVVELSKGLEPIEEGHEGGHTGGNPHFWLDVANSQHYVERIWRTLAEVDPERAGEYRLNAKKYLADLERLNGYIEEKASSIPEERRKMVTFHDAFPYFAQAYGFELVGVIVRNPDAEPSSREVAEIVRAVEEENIPAVFTEPQFSTGLADTVAREAGVKVYELYSDSLSQSPNSGSYEAMMRTNRDRIVEALG